MHETHIQEKKINKSESQKWYLHLDKIHTDYVKIENLSQWLIGNVPKINPNHPSYTKFWSKEAKKCIEGVWGEEFGKYRYMPGNLYFFGNYGVIEHSWEDERGVKVTEDIKPFIVDFIWDYAYQSWVAKGFSGFEKDYDHSCHVQLKKYNEGKLLKSDLPKQCLNQEGEPRVYVEPMEYLKRLHERKMGKSLFQNPTQNYTNVGSRGSSKALLHGSKVQTPNGQVNIEDIQVGDKVFGQNGKPTNVINVSPQGVKQIVEITFKSGRKVKCCLDHLWEVRSWNSKNLQVKRTEDLMKDFRRERFDKRYNKKGWEYKYTLRNNEAVDYTKKDLPIDPYWLGTLLGDGHISNHYTNKLITLTTHQDDLSTYLDNIVLPEDVTYRLHTKKGTNVTTIFFGHNYSQAQIRTNNNTHIYSVFEKLGLSNKYSYEKFIPEDFKYGDHDQRLRLLQGIMDTDGYVVKRKRGAYNIYFSSTSKQLVEDVVYLSRSLGIACGEIRFYDNDYRGSYEVILYTDNKDVFRLQRKRDLVTPNISNREKSRQEWDRIINIEECGSGEATCISVDNEDKLFLTNDFVVTHNSYWSAIGELEYNFVFCGAQRYDMKYINNDYKSQQCVGAHEVIKSAEMVAKFEYSQKCKTEGTSEKFRNWFGIWVEKSLDGTVNTIPSPLYKNHAGNTTCPNKEDMYRAVLKAKINGKWVENVEVASLAHVNYSSKKLGGERAAEGGRYICSIVEECGSCFLAGTKVVMADLSEKNIEDVVEGDFLLGVDGEPNKVVSTITGIDDMYKVSQNNGLDYVVNSKHILCLEQRCNVKTYKDDGYKEYKVVDYVNLPSYKKRTTYGLKTEIDFSKKSLLLDPYWLGLWLGDGSMNGASIVVNFTKDLPVANWVNDYIVANNYNVSLKRSTITSNDELYFMTPTKSQGQKNKFRQALKKYNIFKDKYIPKDYLMSSRNDRLSLLAGLIDSDGSVFYPHTNKQGYEISVSNRPNLTKDIVFLARSLGLRVSVNEKHSNAGYRSKERGVFSFVQRIRISGAVWEIPVKIERKKTSKIKHLKNHKCCSIKVEYVGKDKYYGFSLEKSPYFILPDTTLVHNCPNLIEIMGANEGTLSRGGVRIGYQIVQGTSGNLTSVQATKKVVLDPRSYNMISHKNKLTTDGANGETGYFIPYYITLFQFKDKNGNTDFEKAIAYVNEERSQLAKSKDPAVLRDFCMNKPCYMHEMWWSDAGYYLPYEEFAERERELMFNQSYKSDFHRKCVELVWTPDGNVKQNILFDAVPFDEWPLLKDIKDPSGCVVIYEQPEPDAPHDLYFYTCDPYVEQDLELGGSYAVTYIWKSNKYGHLGFDGNTLVASYIGKPAKGLEYYYEQQEKLIHLYGNTPQGLWFDARGGGETLREYYIKKGKQYILCMRPGLSRGQSAYNSNLTTHGIVIGSQDSKKTALKQAHDWCLQETEHKDGIRKNVHRLPCMFLIKQCMAFEMKGNYDAVSAFYFMPIALHETSAREELALIQRSKTNLFEKMLSNSRIFKQMNN